MKMNKQRMTDRLLVIVLLVLCILTVSQYLLSGLMAKYISTDSAGGSARVAKWEAAIVPTAESPAEAAAGEPYAFQVSSCSETACEYTITVTVPSGIKDLVTPVLAKKDGTPLTAASEEETTAGKIYTYADAGFAFLAASDDAAHAHDYTLTFTGESGGAAVSDNITIKAVFSQMD